MVNWNFSNCFTWTQNIFVFYSYSLHARTVFRRMYFGWSQDVLAQAQARALKRKKNKNMHEISSVLVVHVNVAVDTEIVALDKKHIWFVLAHLSLCIVTNFFFFLFSILCLWTLYLSFFLLFSFFFTAQFCIMAFELVLCFALCFVYKTMMKNGK